MTNTTFAARLARLSNSPYGSFVPAIQRGVEREALRITPTGKLSQQPHPDAVGKALTHDYITTDFSEALLEFITPVSSNIDTLLGQLSDVQKYTLTKMGDESLWPISMPCFIESQDDIPLAQFGSSNIGKMKTLYREGLKNRYGSMMQAIAGVHFNLSFPDSFWQSLLDNTKDLPNAISNGYLGLIRNFKRELWLISYLFGASPALCGSFIGERQTQLPFKKHGKGSLYLEHGTALRLGDLGYTNSAQSTLRVMYNSLEEYVAGLKEAITAPSTLYGQLPDYRAATPKQLNGNILQIENEFYSPIRPKRNAASQETPTEALLRGGIEYIEVRALDVNPFVDTGISKSQIAFLDVFLTYCAVKPSKELDWQEQKETEANLQTVVNFGRDANCTLQQNAEPVALRTWAERIFADLAAVAKVMDEQSDTPLYQNAIATYQKAVNDPALTHSGQYMQKLKADNLDNGAFALQLASQYKSAILARPYQVFSEKHLDDAVESSRKAQAEIEANDNVDFVRFLDEYFA